ncbi:hypothetical protein E1301_Tti022213 [Triplophysa tibetana]|uniref:Uncharacterized protein n=1 Tax=Triplophysa tibetana TaxID=1572043 RepID=A0A5A9PQN2_9TELE|nr:hypothetical protein E1301_Tti023279 [Triplophysa tibetana]KAA0724138.1 hypothetical protein E1301_Tti022213 [Triplophysa tibetana]
MPGNTQKLCPGCNTLISVAFKTCPLCKQLQPYKTKVATKRCNFQNKKAEWKKSIKKNNNRTVVLNSCHVMLDKLAALDFFPILLLGKKFKGNLVADAILGGDYVLDPDLFQRVKLMYEAVLKIHCQRQKKATSSTETTDPPEATATSPPEATATSPPETTATSPPEAAATTPPEAAATNPPEAAATNPPEATPTSPPEATATSPPEATATSPPEATATSPPEATATSPPEATPTSPPEATANSPPEATATSPPELTATSPPEATATSPPEAAATTPPEAAATNPPEATPTSPPEATANSPPEATATSPPEATSTSPPEATATSPPEATATSPPEATATSPPEATGIDITGLSEATRPQAQKAKNRPRSEVHYPVQQIEASKKKKKYECPECCRRVSQNNFDYSKVLKKRVREGTEEVLIRWVPCKTLGPNGRTHGSLLLFLKNELEICKLI